MQIDHKVAEEEFKRAICKAEGCDLYSVELDDEEDFITANPYVYLQAIISGKRAGLIPEVIDEDQFIWNWTNAHQAVDEDGLPQVSIISRAKVKDLNRICLFSVYGEAVADGMKPDAFDVKLTQRMMDAIADVIDVFSPIYSLHDRYPMIGEIMVGSLEVAKKRAEVSELESGLKDKSKTRTFKV